MSFENQMNLINTLPSLRNIPNLNKNFLKEIIKNKFAFTCKNFT